MTWPLNSIPYPSRRTKSSRGARWEDFLAWAARKTALEAWIYHMQAAADKSPRPLGNRHKRQRRCTIAPLFYPASDKDWTKKDSEWRTINGAKILIENGKIVAGAGGKLNGRTVESFRGKPGCNNAFGTKEPEKQHIRCKHACEIKVLFGQPFRGYHGTEAINKLKNEGRGYIPSAFHRDDIGNIDLIYGNECIGLKHIIKERIGRG